MKRSPISRLTGRRWRRLSSLFLLTSLSSIAILSAPSQFDNARAQQIATRSPVMGANWQGASFPVENFQGYSSPFGYRRSATGGYSSEFHYGLDFVAPQGSYVRNWWGGKVVAVISDGRCGIGLVIQSGNWEHVYCHMQGRVETKGDRRYFIDRSGGLQIWEGQTVQSGERIGRVGMTGRTTGPHLHWGLKYDSQWIDPALVLRAMYSEQQAMQGR